MRMRTSSLESHGMPEGYRYCANRDGLPGGLPFEIAIHMMLDGTIKMLYVNALYAGEGRCEVLRKEWEKEGMCFEWFVRARKKMRSK